MKKVALVLFLLFFMSSSAYAADFVEVIETGTAIIYVDVDSVEERDGYIVAWEKWVPKESFAQELREQFKTEIAYDLSLNAYHMDYKLYQELLDIYYDKDGQSVETFTYEFDPDEYEEALPHSLGERIYDFVMETYRAKTQPKPAHSPSASDILGDYLGIVFDPNKTADGYFLVSDVVKGRISDSAGVKVGDKVIKIDTYDLKEYDADRVASYISLRSGHRAIIKVSIDRQGAKKVTKIQL